MMMDTQKNQILAHSFPIIERIRRAPTTFIAFTGIAMLGMATAVALVPSTEDPLHGLNQTVLIETPALKPSTVSAAEHPYLFETRILRSDTIASILGRLNVADKKAFEFILKTPETQAVARQLRPGKVVSAILSADKKLQTLYFPLNGEDALLVLSRKADGDGFEIKKEAFQLTTQSVAKSGEIRHSLFGATDAAGIPDNIAIQLAEIFSGDIDFYRDLHKGDRFSVVYELLTHEGKIIRSGRVLSAEFTSGTKTFNAFWFDTEEGKGGYYTAEGKTLRKAFLRSPLEFSRITSGFSNARQHPVLNITRAHRGVDYAAPIGTRVRAVADGVVEFAGWQNGYGKFIILKHQGTYSTAYGHLNSFAAGISKGARVRQGDTIAATGNTGLSTGPHLHYEFRVSGTQVNPSAIALPEALPLTAETMNSFKTALPEAQALLQLAKSGTPVPFE